MPETPIDIAHVARLARLPLTDEESARFSAQFGRLFEFIRDLQALDVSAVHPTAQVIPLHDVVRPDEVIACLDREAALANAPDRDGPFFKMPRILE